MPITVTGTLFDRIMNRPVGPACIELRMGNQRISTETDRKGDFSVDLPLEGKWTIEPESAPPGDTVYAFTPVTKDIKAGAEDLGEIEVDGIVADNAQMLENYVRNVLLSCSKIFEIQMRAAHAKHPHDFKEEHVKTEAVEVLAIAKAALKHVTFGVQAPAKVDLCAELEKLSGREVLTYVACTYCQYKYANNQTLLQQCICCPDHCY